MHYTVYSIKVFIRWFSLWFCELTKPNISNIKLNSQLNVWSISAKMSLRHSKSRAETFLFHLTWTAVSNQPMDWLVFWGWWVAGFWVVCMCVFVGCCQSTPTMPGVPWPNPTSSLQYPHQVPQGGFCWWKSAEMELSGDTMWTAELLWF